MKTVIFVGGTAYSGSTFFNMILGNDPRAFASGEVRSLFNPSRSQHMDLQCGCGSETCSIWQQVGSYDEKRLYERLFELRPGIDFIVDSSKNPFWIQAQGAHLRSQGIRVKNMLIWKTPLEFALSRKNRNRFRGWDRSWIKYHQLYFSVVDDWRAVAYFDLVHDASTLEGVCQYLGMPYFEGKERYWEKPQHALFGSYSARFHLYSEREAESFLANSIDAGRIQYYRKLYYKNVDDEALQRAVDRAAGKTQQMSKILRVLEQQDVRSATASSRAAPTPHLWAPYVGLRRAWYYVKARTNRYRYGRSSTAFPSRPQLQRSETRA